MAVARHGPRPARLNPLLHSCLQGACPLDGENLIVLFTLDAVKWGTNGREAYECKRELRDMVQNYHGGEFSLFFANCAPQSAVSFDLQARRYCSQSASLAGRRSGMAATP